MRYTLQDFNQILVNGKINKISDDINNLILSLVNEVGSPEYIKTPQFKSRKKNNNKKATIILNDIDDKRSFSKTTFEKKEGIELIFHKVRKYLNTITEQTYDIIKEEIIHEIKNVLLEKTLNDYNYICKEIYNILTTSSLYSKIYTNLYSVLIVEFPLFNELLFNNFDNYKVILDNIEYSKPDVDYDKFCDNNKKNKEVIGIITFYINLFKINIIDKEKICLVITELFNTLDNMILSNDKHNDMDIIAELISILITQCYSEINKIDNEFGKYIYNIIKKNATIKKKECPGISNKCIFKHMDIFEEIKNNEQ